MNKKIIIIVSILTVVAVALVMAVVLQKNRDVKNDEAGKTVQQTSNSGERAVPASTAKSSGDADVDSIEKDLSALSDEDFGDTALSDSEIGL